MKKKKDTVKKAAQFVSVLDYQMRTLELVRESLNKRAK